MTTLVSSLPPDRRSRFRKRFFRGASILLGILVAAGMVEALCSAYAYWKFRTLDVATLTSMESGNTDVKDHRTGYAATLYPHPYLGFVNNKAIESRESGTYERLNNVGLIGRDFPHRKDPKKFTILLTGGSVACQVGRAGHGGKSYLEWELNDRYQFDREVIVLNGGGAAWCQPQQAILYLLYGDVVDAVVTLDGFNERFHLTGNPLRLEMPGGNFHTINPMAGTSYDRLGASWQCQQLKRFSLDHGWRSVYFVTRMLRQRIEANIPSFNNDFSTETIFSLPGDWPRTECAEFNVQQYQKYLRSIDALAKMNGAPVVHFIQPCPTIGKALTDEERRLVGDLSYADVYRSMETDLLKLNDYGMRVVSLSDVFQSTTDSLYEDHIHCRFGPMEPEWHSVNFLPSEGYRIISAAVADHLAESCGVSRRPVNPATPRM